MVRNFSSKQAPWVWLDISQAVYHQVINLPYSRVRGDLRKAGASGAAQDLVVGLLNRVPAERLGAGPADAEAIKEHPFFDDLDWDLVLAKKVMPGYRPEVKDETDTSNFEHMCTRDTKLESVHLPQKQDLAADGGDNVFEGFTFTESPMSRLQTTSSASTELD